MGVDYHTKSVVLNALLFCHFLGKHEHLCKKLRRGLKHRRNPLLWNNEQVHWGLGIPISNYKSVFGLRDITLFCNILKWAWLCV